MAPPKSFPYTDEQLKDAGLLGEGVSDTVKEALEIMRQHPGRLGDVSLSALQSLNSHDRRDSSSPAPATQGEASSRPSASDSPPGFEHIIPEWERKTYYNGISPDPPELLYRSDFFENPYTIPEGEYSKLPEKTIHGVFGSPLSAVWSTVGPQTCQILKDRQIRFTSMSTVRFNYDDEDGYYVKGPIVIWITTFPGSTTPQNARDACPDILALLKANGVEDAVVEWSEGVVEML
ncbi:hypothetical protein DENSPDRAFT_872731 [Dentipellis sp. KUC8613]|nr:hypothetical protein DENSPDRAFT_872731 [Dentipellis sp. KUC8613]